jgi:hypothetical protein
MALDNTAADAALEVWIDTLSPTPTETQKTSIRDNLRPLIRAIYAGIVANAVVSPDGTGTDLNVGGAAVTGTGKLL